MQNTFCNNCGKEILVRIIETAVPGLCPACGPIYSIAKFASNSNLVSKDVRDMGSAICGIMLVFAGALFLDNLLFSKRR